MTSTNTKAAESTVNASETALQRELRQPLTRTNFMLMIAAGVMIVVGFLLMLGSGSSAENGFNPDIFSTRRVVVGPIVAFLGFLFMAFGIIYQPRSRRGTNRLEHTTNI